MSIDKSTLQKLYEREPEGCAFVETGSHKGDTIATALDIGFVEVRSVESGMELYEQCAIRFKNDSRVSLFHGNSGKRLRDMCEDIDGDILFWLDAHYSGGDTNFAGKICPLYEELDHIKTLNRNTHTILIDDVRDIHNGYMQVTLSEIESRLLDINPNYVISYLPGHQADDILMASVR